MRKINIAPRLAALITLDSEIAELSAAIYASGYSYRADPVAYWFPSDAEAASELVGELRTMARRLPGVQDPRHGVALAAIRAELARAERELRAIRDRYALALRMAQAMERPTRAYTHVIQLAGEQAVRRATRGAPRWID